jgi:hypothetical protein
MGLGTNHQTITTGDNFIPEVWGKELQRATENNLVMGKLVKRFDAEMKSFGDVLHIPKISNLSATAKSASTAVTFSSPTEGVVDLTINKHYHVALLIERNLDAKSKYNLAEEYKEKMSYALAKQIDTDTMALQSGLSQTVGTDNVAVTDAVLLSAIQKLDEADAPESDRSCVVSPATKMDLIQISRLSSSDFVNMADRPVVNGFFDSRYGVNFYVTNNTVAGSSGHVNVLFHKEALALAIQTNPQLYSDFIIEYLGDAYVMDVKYGVVEYRDAFGVTILGK